MKIDYRPSTGASTGRRPRRLKTLVMAGAVFSVLGGAVLFGALHSPQQPSPASGAETLQPAVPSPPAGEPATAMTELSQPQPIAAGLAFDSIDIIIKRNDTLDRIFRKLNLSINDLAVVRNLPDARQALDFIKPGDALTVMHQDGSVHGLVRRINDTQTLSVTREESGFAAQILENPLETAIERKQGRIDSSLFLAANAAGISDATAMTLANIFGWDIDFVLDIRTGDEFTVVYEQLWQDGEFVRDGNILATQFVNNGRTYQAVRYERADGQADYFAPDGRSMRKAFLRAPLEFTRVSSNFNPRRRHPVLNTIRAHKGVDYAAPQGTPVRAAGDGRVQLRGWHGGYGNAVVLEHGGGVTTLYGHLSRFGRGLKHGQRVRQGQLIGYVGKTGLASGPHLHYEYRLNGVHRNPRTVKLPDADPISADLTADFKTRTAPLLAELEQRNPKSLLAQR